MSATSSFTLIDIVSQAVALQKHMIGWSKEELICWLQVQGTLKEFTDIYGNEVFSFESSVGFFAIFYLQGTRFTFVFPDDNTTYQPE
jgi:hypothetical protein